MADQKDIKLYVSEKQLGNVFHSKPYTTKDGKEFTVELREIKNINLGTLEEPKFGRFSVKANKVIPQTTKDGKQIEGRFIVFIPSDKEISIHFDELTGNQIQNKEGKMVNEHTDIVQKWITNVIVDKVKANNSEYKKSLEEQVSDAKNKAAEHDSKQDKEVKTQDKSL